VHLIGIVNKILDFERSSQHYTELYWLYEDFCEITILRITLPPSSHNVTAVSIPCPPWSVTSFVDDPKVLHLEHSFVCVETLTLHKVDQKYPESFKMWYCKKSGG
jgi:hypothetical protein